jgi:hypothetical protein
MDSNNDAYMDSSGSMASGREIESGHLYKQGGNSTYSMTHVETTSFRSTPGSFDTCTYNTTATVTRYGYLSTCRHALVHAVIRVCVCMWAHTIDLRILPIQSLLLCTLHLPSIVINMISIRRESSGLQINHKAPLENGEQINLG